MRTQIYRNYQRANSNPRSGKRYFLPLLFKAALEGIDDKDAIIFDIGSGRGLLLEQLSNMGYKNAVGFDAFPSHDNSADLRVISASVDSLQREMLRDARVIILSDVIEHLSDQQIEHLLSIVPSECWLLVRTPNISGFCGLDLAFGDCTHVNYFNEKSLYQLLISFGYSDITFGNDLYVSSSVFNFFRQRLALLIVKLILGFKRIVLGGGVSRVATPNLVLVCRKL